MKPIYIPEPELEALILEQFVWEFRMNSCQINLKLTAFSKSVGRSFPRTHFNGAPSAWMDAIKKDMLEELFKRISHNAKQQISR